MVLDPATISNILAACGLALTALSLFFTTIGVLIAAVALGVTLGRRDDR